MAKNSTLFKLFMNDVGLLSCASGADAVRKAHSRARPIAPECVGHGRSPAGQLHVA